MAAAHYLSILRFTRKRLSFQTEVSRHGSLNSARNFVTTIGDCASEGDAASRRGEDATPHLCYCVAATCKVKGFERVPSARTTSTVRVPGVPSIERLNLATKIGSPAAVVVY